MEDRDFTKTVRIELLVPEKLDTLGEKLSKFGDCTLKKGISDGEVFVEFDSLPGTLDKMVQDLSEQFSEMMKVSPAIPSE